MRCSKKQSRKRQEGLPGRKAGKTGEFAAISDMLVKMRHVQSSSLWLSLLLVCLPARADHSNPAIDNYGEARECYSQGDFRGAISILQHSDANNENINVATLRRLNLLGCSYQKLGFLQDAQTVLESASRMADALPYCRETLDAKDLLAINEVLLRRWSAAATDLETARTLAEKQHDAEGLARLGIDVGCLDSARGDYAQALKDFKDAQQAAIRPDDLNPSVAQREIAARAQADAAAASVHMGDPRAPATAFKPLMPPGAAMTTMKRRCFL